MTTRRIALAICTALTASAATLWLPSAQAQNKVTVYSAAPQDLLDKVIPAFEKSSNLKVDVIKAGSGDLINRLKAEKGRPTADVLFAVGTEVIEANPTLFTKFTPENAKYLSDNFKIVDAAIPFTAVASAFGVNTKLLTPAQYPQTWQDLAKPIYKGKISAARPDKSGSAFIQLATILQLYGEDKGWALYAKILDNTVLSNSSGAVPKFVNDGEATVGIGNEDVLLKFKQGGGPVQLVYPSDGTSMNADAAALIVSAPNPEGGKAFINYMLSRSGQEIVDAAGRRSVRSDVVSKNALLPLAKLNVVKYNLAWAASNRARILSKWNELLLNKN